MKKLVSLLTTLVLLFCMSTTSLAATRPIELSTNDGLFSFTSSTPKYYGEFVVPSVGIDVKLYNSNSAAVCDAEDSACFYHFSNVLGMTIADHASQGFKTLKNVTPGTEAMIYQENGGIIYIRCEEICDGTNTGSKLLDNNGKDATGKADYLTYCCLDSKGVNIRICQWNIVRAENIDPKYDNQFNIDTRTKSHVAAYATNTVNKTTTYCVISTITNIIKSTKTYKVISKIFGLAV